MSVNPLDWAGLAAAVAPHLPAGTGKRCNAQSATESGTYFCTAEKGHDGDHGAYTTWPENGEAVLCRSWPAQPPAPTASPSSGTNDPATWCTYLMCGNSVAMPGRCGTTAACRNVKWKTAVEGVALCDQVAQACRCRKPANHGDPHVCPCGASWTGDIDRDDFEVIALPPAAPVPGLAIDEEW